jgi:hypothetical protein
MRSLRKSSILFGLLALLGAGSAAHAQYLFASFEDQKPDGFGYFSNSSGVVPFSTAPASITYSYTNTGATNGVYALDLNASGYNQNDLAYDFVASGHLSQFLANDVLSFTMTAPASSTGSGYWQIYSLAFNAPGYGYQNLGSSPFFNQYPPYNGTPNTISVNYDAVKAAMSSNPGYVQFIITTNQGSGAPADFDFDNFTLSSVPEPATAGLALSTAVPLLLRRRRAAR